MSLTIADAAIAIGADFSDGKFQTEVSKGVNQHMTQAGKTGSAAMGKEMVAGGTAAGQGMGASIKTALSPKNLLAGVGMGIGLQLFQQAQQALTGLLSDAQAAYREDQVSVERLGQALKNNIPAWDGNTVAIEKVIKANMRLAFGDEEQRDSMALLVGATKNVAEAQQIEAAAMDLARVKKVDLATATQSLILAHAGNYRGLKALGITLDSTATFTEALTQVTKIAGGQAEIYANTDLGKQEAAQIRVQESLETLGGIISKVSSVALPILAGALAGALDLFGILGDNMDIAGPALLVVGGAILGVMVPALLAMAVAAWTAALPVIALAAPFVALGAVVVLLALAFEKNFMGIQGIVKAGAAVIIGVAKGIIGTWLNLAGTLVSVAAGIPGPWQGAAQDLQKTLDDMRTSVDGWGEDTAASVKETGTKTVAAFRGHLGPIRLAADDTFGAVTKSAKTAWLEVLAEQDKTLGGIYSAIREAKNKLASLWGDAMDASARAQEIGYEKEINLAQQAAIKKEQANSGAWSKLSAEDQAQESLKLLNLQTSYAKLLVEDASYGTQAAQIAKLNGLLNSREYLDGLNSTDGEIRQHWIDVGTDTKAQLFSLQGWVGDQGTATGKAFAGGFVTDAVKAQIAGATGTFWSWLKSGLSGTISIKTDLHDSRGVKGAWAAGTPYVPESGFYDVGELGRERVFLPQGAAVMSHQDLTRSGGGGSPTVNNYTFNGITNKSTAIDTMREHALRQLIGAI